MKLQNEILEYFASLRSNGAIPIESLPIEYPGWVIRIKDRYGVAIEVNTEMLISERFSNAKLKTENHIIGGRVVNLLTFTCSLEDLRIEFANLSAQFVYPGEDGQYRRSLLKSPRDWWTRWSSILGNSFRVKSPSQVIAELLTFKYYFLKEENPKWIGHKGKSHDIEFNTGICEVKSTSQRYGFLIDVNSQFQLKAEKTTLFVSAFRFENSIHGISINSVSNELYNLGVDRKEIINGLDNLGYEEGMGSLDESYALLDARLYEVNDSFPRITSDSFVQGVIPIGIVKIKYTIDLENIAHANITHLIK
jgi:hypothetical protein